MKRFGLYSLVFTVCLLFAFSAWGNQVVLQQEPSLSMQKGWDVQPNGLMFISYDLDENGETRFHYSPKGTSILFHQ